VKDGHLHPIRLGRGSWRLPAKDLIAFIQSCPPIHKG
jgi:hypothetical protein